MGAFNVILIDWEEKTKKKTIPIVIQFKYGELWQHEYRIGDVLKWGINEEGDPKDREVIVFGCLQINISSSEENEKYKNVPEEFDVYIVDNKITKVLPLYDYSKYFKINREFIVLK